MLNELLKKDLLTEEFLAKSDEWEEVRVFSNELIEMTYPFIRLPSWPIKPNKGGVPEYSLLQIIKWLARDYETQQSVIPDNYHLTLPRRLKYEFQAPYQNLDWVLEEGLITKNNHSKIKEINQMVDKIFERDLGTLKAVETSSEWHEIRMFSRKLLEMMGKEIKPPSLETTTLDDYLTLHYVYFGLVEGIRGLAMEYEIQLSLIPSQIHWALPDELCDDIDRCYGSREWLLEEGLINNDHFSKIVDLNQMLDEIFKKEELATQEAVEKSEEWNDVRLFSRKLLEMMDEEIRPPTSWTREGSKLSDLGDIFI